MQLFTSNGTPVQLGEMLGSGGEGWIYEVNNHPTRTSLVAKVFFSPEKAAQKEAKLRYMIQNPPESIEQNGHTFLAWPLELLFDEQGQFTGFLMPKAEGVELEYLCSDDFESYPEFQSPEWKKFYFSNPEAAHYRLRTAANICAAVYALHAKGYVIGDLKPVNIFVLPNGLISIADLDSIQIHTKEGHFPSMAVTPEYAPPESKDMEVGDFKNEGWDRFSLAIILYRFLVGIHPFTGTLKPPYDKLTTYEELIRHGLYPNGSRKDFFEVIPPTHQRLFTLYPPAIAKTFEWVFDSCLFEPDKRPSALEWSSILYEALKTAAVLKEKKPQVWDNKAYSFTKNHLAGKITLVLSIIIVTIQIAMLVFNKYLPMSVRLLPTPWLLQGILISLYALSMPALFTNKKEYSVHTLMLIMPPLIVLQFWGLSFFFDDNDSLHTPVFYYCIILLFANAIYSYLVSPKENKHRKKASKSPIALHFLVYFICTAYVYFVFLILKNIEYRHPEKFLFIEGDFLNKEVLLGAFQSIVLSVAVIGSLLYVLISGTFLFVGILFLLKKIKSLWK